MTEQLDQTESQAGDQGMGGAAGWCVFRHTQPLPSHVNGPLLQMPKSTPIWTVEVQTFDMNLQEPRCH